MAAKKNSSTRRTWLTVAGVVVLPLLLVATMVATVWGADQRNDQVKAAIVNLDEPVTLDDGQYVPLGRQLAGKLSGLTNVPGLGEEATNYDWQVTNAEEAAEGLRTGRYAAVVTIPENFSEAATSTADADKAEQALVDIEISPRASSVDPSLARTVVQAAIDTLNTELTETFLDNIFVGFTTMGEQFKTISDASEQLADGTHELANGIDELDDGVSELADGTEQLDSGGAELSDGVKQYVGGVTSLADGLKQLDQQVSQMPGQVKQLADGADQTADGADELAKGAKQLSGGASDLADGIDQTGAGAKQFADQLGTAASGAKQLGEAATGANAAAQGLAMGLQGYSSALQGALEVVSCPDDYESGSPECDAYVRGKTEGLQFALQALEPLDLDTTLTGLAQATGGLDQGINGDEGLANGLDQAADGAKQLSDGINGTKKQPGLSQGARQLASGAKELSGGTEQLAGGSRQLADGTRQLANGLPQLSDGISQLADGAGTLSSTGPQLSNGISEYTEGVSQLNDGVAGLSDGVGQLADGARELDKGQRQLSDGLKSGASQVPTYSDSERERLSTVVSRPVTTGDDTGPRLFSDPASLSAIAGIALWLGALLGAWLLGSGAVNAWRSSAATWRLAVRNLAPVAGIATAQGLIFGGLVAWLTDGSGGAVAQLLGIGALAGLSFAAVTVGLSSLLGRAGQFVAVAVGILAVGMSLVTALPAGLSFLRPVLPTTSAIDAFTGVTGPIPGLGGNVAALVAWLVAGVAAAILGVHRHRQVKLAPIT